MQVQGLKERYTMYEVAVGRRQLWQEQFAQGYRWLMPYRLPLISNDPVALNTNPQQRGKERNDHIFDPTGEQSVYAFANNIQMTVMPPFTHWAKVQVSDEIIQWADAQNTPPAFETVYGPITSDTIASMKDQLEHINKTIFAFMNSSKLEAIINECFQDLAISMGVLLINEGDLDNPLRFESIPANNVIIGSAGSGDITNVWRPITIDAKNILHRWPNAVLSQNLQRKVDNSPNEEIQFVEGTITYPNNPEGFKYYYFVMTIGGEEEILCEWRDIFPWVIFRGTKAPGELYGRGPGLMALPMVRVLNRTVELNLRGLQFSTIPLFVYSNGMFNVNPYTFTMQPGALLEAPNGVNPRDAISSITGESPDYALEYIQNMRAMIQEIMFANPLNLGQQTKTATEAQIINNQWVQKNAGFFSRMSLELFPPLIDKVLYILTKKGAIPQVDINGVKRDVRIDNILFKLNYNSPLAKLQAMKDVQNIEQAVQFAANTFGPEGLVTFHIGELPIEVYEKLDVPSNLINYDFKDSPIVHQILQTVNTGQLPGQQQGAPPPTPALGNAQQTSAPLSQLQMQQQ